MRTGLREESVILLSLPSHRPWCQHFPDQARTGMLICLAHCSSSRICMTSSDLVK
ncbi:hypothetical protein BCR41DRAFT_348661 [Lobosporangium transversale]|uniref:Uncharacterized protein n=1 Tax=Lobosporangium transversale TaxID=64571 RepID=A0A1Y2GWF2_9FUNG|nr:hypothetical protein BCR41DRAFT_348661 [Lobosporangium transversale]ORZ24875.1 hypothetical protein BCR41DRAFT_348661 [Lobosporangium transversale]|eukprot:XP_021883856.1 hypothetical protein BCR41DRAFT_348661 [Lobosporangium transversale]